MGQFHGWGQKIWPAAPNTFHTAQKLGNKKVLAGSVILSTRAPIGYVSIASNELYTNQGCHSILPSQEHDSNYLYYWLLQNNKILNDQASGTTFRELSGSNLKSLSFLAPQKFKQKQISSLLSTQESLISDLESLLSKQKQRFSYLSEELLSGRLRVREVNGKFELYKNPDDNWQTVEMNGEMVEIPKDWDTIKLENIATLNHKSQLAVSKFSKIKQQYPAFTCSKSQDYYSPSFNTDGENLFFSTGGMGAVHHFQTKCAYSSDVLSLKLSGNTKFFFYVFKSNIRILDGMFYGAGLKHLNRKEFLKHSWLSPTPENQTNITEILSTQESLISDLESLLSKQKQRFSYLSEALLSGQITLEQ